MAVTPKYNIYYPTDYTAVADIPSNMQEMAESIENGIDEAVGDIDLSDYYTKSEIDNMIGDINTVLDTINGEVI